MNTNNKALVDVLLQRFTQYKQFSSTLAAMIKVCLFELPHLPSRYRICRAKHLCFDVFPPLRVLTGTFSTCGLENNSQLKHSVCGQLSRWL